MKKRLADIVIAGYAAAAGAAIIAEKNRKRLLSRYSESYINNAIKRPLYDFSELKPEKLEAEELIISGEGGILATLYKYAKERGCGMSIALKRIPVLQSSIEISEFFGLNPYRLYSDAAVIICENGERTCRILREMSIEAECIGSLEAGLDKLIIDKEEAEYINRPEPDELFKLCGRRILTGRM